MKKWLMMAAVIWGMSSPAYAEAEKFTFDTSHTSILFFINHGGFSDFVGEFLDYDGHVMLDEDNPEDSSIDVTIKPRGIKTDLPDFDDKLQNDSFFNTSAFPNARFVSTKVEQTGENTAKVTGDFTMLGVTKPLVLDITLNKIGKDQWRNTYKAGFSITGTIKRSEWGLTYALPAVGDDVRLMIEAEVERPLKDGE